MTPCRRSACKSGFTLIELSIVLVIIGLIVGGILVGQDLIKSAEVRAQITQIEKFNQSVNTFRGKFAALPGDLPLSLANQFGFTPGSGCNGTQQGFRNGDGLIDGWQASVQMVQGQGETGLFFVDLSSAAGGSLIPGSFPNSGASMPSCIGGSTPVMSPTSTPPLSSYFPVAAIGHGNYMTVYETSGYNWYGISQLTATTGPGAVTAGASVPVIQAYNIDKKMDNGIPISGVVLASMFLNGYSVLVPSPTNATDNTTSCYNTTNSTYSISSLSNYGGGGNCALAFRFQ